MSYSKLILRDSAEIVWPLDDITESSSVSKAINFFTENPNSYSASINPAHTNLLKNPIVFGGGTLLSFTSSAVGLSIPALGRFSELYNNKESVISFWFQSNKLFNEEYPIFKKRGHQNIGLFIKNNYLIFKYGTSASYTESATDFVNIKEPHHIVVAKTNSGLSITLNGRQVNSFKEIINLEKDNQHIENDYIDFYGPPEKSWNIDSIAIYPNSLDPSICKRHYVYGLGKNISDDIFYSRGGNLYNMSTVATERIADINWDYKNEWEFKDLINLTVEDDGIKPIPSSYPNLYSIDNFIDKNNNSLSFNLSASNTKASYIQVNQLNNKVDLNQPILLKVKLDGELPDEYINQRILSYGQLPNKELLTFDLYNDGGTYKIKVSAQDSASVSFNISNFTASPSIYLGVTFSNSTLLHFAEPGSVVQSSSFSYISASGYGLDPMISFFPPTSEIVLRVGSAINYDSNTFTDLIYDVNQFYGTFERLMIMQDSITASTTFNDLDNYRKSRYGFVFDSHLNRFKMKTYGYGNFNIHSAQFAEYIDDVTEKIGANVINFGYPNIQSSSQVYFYVTHTNYSGSVIYPRTEILENNYLGFINNTNVSSTFLTFDFEIYAEDSIAYPPKIKYFQMQTLKSRNNATVMRDQGGPDYILYPSSSSAVYVPEIRYTPSIFMTEDSGLKLNNTQVDFTESIFSVPLDPTIIPGLKVWLDSRFINGLNIITPDDDSRVIKWTDLSGNNNHAVQNISASAPVYRAQSLNILRSNQLNGSDTEDLSFIGGVNLTTESSPDGAAFGKRGIKTIPNNSSTDSYLDLSLNTASITTFPNQSYTVVGTIKLDKAQTASALHPHARKIVILNSDGITETLSASSFAATNSAGVYSLSAIFSTDSSTVKSIFRFYNGSFSEKDVVYWDRLGVYPISSASPLYSWVMPLTDNDRPTVKFKQPGMELYSTASTTHPSSLYIVARNFGDSIFIQNTTASILYSNSASYFVSNGSPQNFSLSDNRFHVFSIINNGSNTELFIDGVSYGTKNTGSSNIDRLIVGRALSGDISSIVLYEGQNNTRDRQRIENWLKESFEIL